MDLRSDYLCTGINSFYFCLLYIVCHFDFCICANYIIFVCCDVGDMVTVRAQILMVVCFWIITHMIGTNRISDFPGVVSSLWFSTFMDRIFTISWRLRIWKNDMSYLSFLMGNWLEGSIWLSLVFRTVSLLRLHVFKRR